MRRQQQKAWERIQKIKNKEARESYRRWYDLQAQILDYKEQAITGKIKTPKKNAPSEFDDLRAERNLWASRVRSQIAQSEVPIGQKIALETAATIRGTILGADIGVLFRQGLFSTVRPKAFTKGVIEASKTAFSDKNIARWQQRMDEARDTDGVLFAVKRKRAGLQVTDTLNNREEFVVSRLMEKIPGIGKVVGGSLTRFQTTFINTARAETFDAAVRRGYSVKELELRAQFINNATGRG